MAQQQQSESWNAELLEIRSPRAITWASRGGDGSGKSYFGCTAPAPIWVAAFDPRGPERVDPAIREGKEIRIGRYGFSHLKIEDDRQAVKRAAREIWDRFAADYERALKHARTILWDREDLAWELLRYASFGGEKNEGSKTGQLDYGDLNAEYVGLIQLAGDSGVNLGLLQGLTDKWESKFDPQRAAMRNYNTGKQVPDGFKKVSDHVDITLDHAWNPEKKKYITTLRKFPNPAQRDEEHEDLIFPTMATLAFPSSELEDWL